MEDTPLRWFRLRPSAASYWFCVVQKKTNHPLGIGWVVGASAPLAAGSAPLAAGSAFKPPFDCIRQQLLIGFVLNEKTNHPLCISQAVPIDDRIRRSVPLQVVLWAKPLSRRRQSRSRSVGATGCRAGSAPLAAGSLSLAAHHCSRLSSFTVNALGVLSRALCAPAVAVILAFPLRVRHVTTLARHQCLAASPPALIGVAALIRAAGAWPLLLLPREVCCARRLATLGAPVFATLRGCWPKPLGFTVSRLCCEVSLHVVLLANPAHEVVVPRVQPRERCDGA